MDVKKIIITISYVLLITIIFLGIIQQCGSNRDREAALSKSREIEKRSTELAFRLVSATAGLEKAETYGRTIQAEADRVRAAYDRSETARQYITDQYNKLEQFINSVDGGFTESLKRIDIIEAGLGSIKEDIGKLQH